MRNIFASISLPMARPASLAIALAAALFSIGVASPIVARPPDPEPRIVDVPGYGPIIVQPKETTDEREQPRIVNVPGYGNVYVLPVRPRDTRTPRQRCIDAEVANEGGSPSPLARRAIDLKCSQR